MSEKRFEPGQAALPADMNMDKFPPLLVQVNALAQQVGFALTREEAAPDA
ncbi:MAG TPA: hypothetical protein VN961_10335 [Streptosporangiaceae bacterium]|nr:hypothetical protein [Streptosporangiaceae bacterium]